MKIDNSRIFTADIYEVINPQTTEYGDYDSIIGGSGTSTSDCDVVIGGRHSDRILHKNTVVVYFKELGYVPVWHLRNIIDYANVKLISNSSKNFLKEEIDTLPENGSRFIKNIHPLFSYPGKTSLSELIGIQKYNHDRDFSM